MNYSTILNSSVSKVTNKLSLHFLSVDTYDDSVKQLIDDSIALICNGILGDKDIDIVKIELSRWFTGKDENKKSGFIAEFFCHLYLKQLEFEQHFLFKNLEETNSMKKGFDGLFQFKGETWLYESKSSLHTTISANHNSNISEAFNDIKKKINGTKLDSKGYPIDPWSNAINHASLIQVNPNETLIGNLNKFKKRFFKNDFENIKNFNVIPNSTIYLEDRWAPISQEILIEKLKALTTKYEYKSMNIICVNKESISDFEKYLNDV